MKMTAVWSQAWMLVVDVTGLYKFLLKELSSCNHWIVLFISHLRNACWTLLKVIMYQPEDSTRFGVSFGKMLLKHFIEKSVCEIKRQLENMLKESFGKSCCKQTLSLCHLVSTKNHGMLHCVENKPNVC